MVCCLSSQFLYEGRQHTMVTEDVYIYYIYIYICSHQMVCCLPSQFLYEWRQHTMVTEDVYIYYIYIYVIYVYIYITYIYICNHPMVFVSLLSIGVKGDNTPWSQRTCSINTQEEQVHRQAQRHQPPNTHTHTHIYMCVCVITLA